MERIGPDVIGNESVSIWYGLFSNSISNSMIDSVIEGSAADMEFVSHAWEDINTLLGALSDLEFAARVQHDIGAVLGALEALAEDSTQC